MTSRLWCPGQLRPMLAVRAEAPFDSDQHLYELKWDGYRCLAFLSTDTIFLQSRNGLDMTALFPELRVLSRYFRGRAIVDGELVTWREGRPDFAALQRRAQARDPRRVQWWARHHPVSFVAFDLLHFEGRDLDGLPCEERRRLLAQVLGAGHGAANGSERDVVVFSPALAGSSRQLFQRVTAAGFEGLIAKRRASPYRFGRRSRDWLKIVRHRQAQCVIGGVTAGAQYGIGALLIGAYALPGDTKLTYLGHVGTGFQRDDIHALAAHLRPRRECPFQGVPAMHRRAVWVEPEVVCDVSYLELTPERRLRHPVFRGLRPDLDPRDCRVPWSEDDSAPWGGDGGASDDRDPRPGR